MKHDQCLYKFSDPHLEFNGKVVETNDGKGWWFGQTKAGKARGFGIYINVEKKRLWESFYYGGSVGWGHLYMITDAGHLLGYTGFFKAGK